MNLYVNGTTLTVENAWTERDEATGIITLYVHVPYATMDYSALKELFKSNTEDMIKTADDGTEETFSGFVYAKPEDDEESQCYVIKLTSDENAFQLGRNRQLEKDKASLESTVTAKDSEIATLNNSITEKDKTIAEKSAAIEVKDGTIAKQTETIATLEAEIEELKNSTGEVDLSEFATALEEGVNDYE